MANLGSEDVEVLARYLVRTRRAVRDGEVLKLAGGGGAGGSRVPRGVTDTDRDLLRLRCTGALRFLGGFGSFAGHLAADSRRPCLSSRLDHEHVLPKTLPLEGTRSRDPVSYSPQPQAVRDSSR